MSEPARDTDEPKRILLRSARAGEVQLVGCPDVQETLAELEQTDRSQSPESGLRFVACTWAVPPVTGTIIEETLDRLAETALALWPQWYGAARPTVGDLEPGATAAEWAREVSGSAHPSLLTGWVQEAVARCEQGRLPRTVSLSRATEALQLALAIEPQQFVLALGATTADGEPARLYGLARAAEWFASQTRAGLLILVPTEVVEAGELDNVNFGAIRLPARSEPARELPEEKAGLLIWPFEGGPHPHSRGEQLLADRIQRDPELAGLFQFNQAIQTVRGTVYRADLLCGHAQMVVEVDGYHWHSGWQAFCQDRERDYELTLTGYVTLRLPHDEVVADVDQALEKIRDVVRFRLREDAPTAVESDDG